jgi:hypothetical protein
MVAVPMKFRVLLLLIACIMLVASAMGQTAQPASSQPAQQSPPAKDQAPAESKPAAPAPPTAGTANPGPAPTLENPPQDPDKADEGEPVTTIKVPVNEVRVIFTVTDKHGRYIKDMKKNDFVVVDD